MPATSFRNIDPAELLRLNDLELLARGVVEGFMNGLHRSPASGVSIEFAQYRPYAQGDDPRFVDWKLYGRTDRLHVKQFQEETNLRATILLDCSASMDYGSGAITKFQYARMLAACLAALLAAQRDATGFIAYHERVLTHLPPRGDRLHLRRILSEIDALAPASAARAGDALAQLGAVIKPRGIVVLISDLLHPLEEVIPHLKSLRARRHEVIVFQISDPAEQTFPFDRTATFIDAEDRREQFAVPDMIRAEYLANRAAHFGALREECARAEIDLVEVATTEPLDAALRAFLRRRGRALLTTSRMPAKAGAV